MLCRPLAELGEQAERIAAAVGQHAPGCQVSVVEGCSQMGSGSLPTQELPTRLVAVASADIGPQDLAQRLRQLNPPVFVRLHKGQVLLDPRTLLDGEEAVLVQSLVTVLTRGG